VLCVAASGPPMPPAEPVVSPKGSEVFSREVAVAAVVPVFRIYNRELTAEEVLMLYNMGTQR